MSNKVAAKKLMEILLRQGAELDSYALDIRAICDESEFKKYRKIVANIMGSILLDGINVLSDEFPDLKPKELDDSEGSGTS